MDEGNDGRFPDDSAVEVRYPQGKEEQGDRSAWPWLPGSTLEQCAPDEWRVCVEARELAMLDDGSPAPTGRRTEICSTRAASGTPARSGVPPTGSTGDPGGGGGHLVLLAGDHRRVGRDLYPAQRDRIARQVEGLGLVICLNTIPVGWPAALLLACLMPCKEISHAPQPQPPRGQ
jgi:hypothetical protein